MIPEWNKPYRSIDAGGSPESASAVAWDWINARADEAKKLYGPVELVIETSGQGDCSVVALYHRTKPICVATVFRDPMNHAVLVRWVG